MQPKTKAEARAQKSDRYWPDERCPRCRTRERWTKSGACVTCDKERLTGVELVRRAPDRPKCERKEAARKRQKTYRSTSCKHGHNAPRYTSTGRCVECTLRPADKPKKRDPILDHLDRGIYRDMAYSQDEARQKGEDLYYTGKLCRNKHKAPRRSSDRRCIRCLHKEQEKARARARAHYLMKKAAREGV